MKRIWFGLKLFWYGVSKYEVFASTVFENMAILFEHALKVCNENKPFTTHLFLGDKRIVSFWMYPGLTKNPVDRITELLTEIEGLKDVAKIVPDTINAR